MRYLHEKEKNLIGQLLDLSENYEVVNLEKIQVKDLLDGCMGSIFFLSENKSEVNRKMYKCIAEKEFLDSDGVPISVTLNIDDDGLLYELDIWKVDFSPIIKYPN